MMECFVHCPAIIVHCPAIVVHCPAIVVHCPAIIVHCPAIVVLWSCYSPPLSCYNCPLSCYSCSLSCCLIASCVVVVCLHPIADPSTAWSCPSCCNRIPITMPLFVSFMFLLSAVLEE